MLDEPRVLVRGKADARGLVKYAYHTAAEVTDFVIMLDPSTRRLTLGGTVRSQTAWLASRPLVFVVMTKGGALRWPIDALDVTGGQVRAQLGALLERE